MRMRIQRTASGLALALGLGAGCEGQRSPQSAIMAPPDPAVVEAAIRSDLERLDRLEIVEVVDLMISLSAEATACYGQPCPGSAAELRAAQERARQAPRLSALADIAERVAADTTLTPRPTGEAQAALAALSALQIVEVSDLVTTQPQNEPSCYNLPCPGERARVEAENGLRVAQVFAIAGVAERDGL